SVRPGSPAGPEHRLARALLGGACAVAVVGAAIAAAVFVFTCRAIGVCGGEEGLWRREQRWRPHSGEQVIGQRDQPSGEFLPCGGRRPLEQVSGRWSPVRQLMLVSMAWQASAHRWHSSAQAWQWLIWVWRAHSSRQLLHACTHACSIARVMLASYSVWRDSTRSVTSQMSAQSRFVRMHLRISATSFSLRHASAQAVHAWAHVIAAWEASASRTRSSLISA